MNSPNCNHNPETTVFCHGNDAYAGKGFGMKADDCFGFFGCSGCHAWYDGYEASKDELNQYFLKAHYRTIRRLLDLGVLK